MKPAPTNKRLSELLDYNPETGIFRWRLAGRNRRVGSQAGGFHLKGYRQIRVDGLVYMAHRLAWFMVYGTWPPQIDHINRDPSDNRIANLRAATQSQNRANSKVPVTSISGIKGVRKIGSRWQARIRVNGKLNYLGQFKTAAEASAAYAIAAQQFFGEFARCA